MTAQKFRLFALIGALTAIIAACSPSALPTPPATMNTKVGSTGPSAGCEITERGPVDERSESIVAAGLQRRYTITVPPQHAVGTSEPFPLVFDFHGLSEGWFGFHPFATQFNRLAATEGFIVVSPIGSGDGLYWDINNDESNSDLQFVDAMIDRFANTMCVDQSRIYTTGLSYGGFMTSMLMCMRPNVFAAAAPVAGMWNSCADADRDIPFVGFHGTDDWILRYSMFEHTPGLIAAKYGCDPTPRTETLTPNPEPSTGGAITRMIWDCSDSNTAAEFYSIEGGGHTWPGSEFFSWLGFVVGPTPMTLDATAVIWEFFEQHALSDLPAN